MRLQRLTVKDFGLHKSRDLDLDAPVVGLIGAGGSGKSTLLAAIKFALTGELRDPLATYIRGRGVNAEDLAAAAKDDPGSFEPAKSAEVLLDFSTGGREGCIQRKITKTSTTRRLSWGDDKKSISTAAEVDAAMLDLLGADKAAISEIVFPEQGALVGMLLGRQSERENLFIKLLLLTHFSKVSDLAEQKSRLLRGSVQDLGAQRDQLNEIKGEAVRRVESIRGQLSGLRDWSADLEGARAARAALADAVRADANRASVEEKVSELRRSLSGTLSSMNVGPDGSPLSLASRSQLDDLVEEARKDARAMSETIMAQQETQARISRRTALEAERTEMQGRLDEVESAVSDIQAWKSAAGADGDPEGLRARIRISEDLERKAADLAEAERELQTCRQELDHLYPERDSARVDEDRANQVYEETGRAYSLALARRDATQAACEHGGSSCLLCGGTFQATPEKLSEAGSELSSIERELERAREAKNRESSRLSAANARIAGLEARIEPLRGKIESMKSEAEGSVRENIAELRLLLKEATDKESQLSALTGRDEAGLIRNRLRLIHEELEGIPQGTFDPRLLEAAQAAKIRLDSFLSSAENLQRTIDGLTGSLKTAEEARDRAVREVEDSKARYESARKELGQKVLELEKSGTDGEGLGHALAVMEGLQEEYQRTAGQLSQARSQVEEIDQRLRRLEEREASDARRMQVADDLSRVKEAFARRGLPMAYVQDRFERLTDLANRNLEFLDANFVVQVDPTEFVSLNFVRSDDPSGAVFAANKLSGSQRVRLSIAFLLAVQQLIIPDLGLLVLDEPSMHLDHESVESLADLLSNLGTQLQSADAQIIVCDHNHRLERAFGKTIDLSKS